MFSLHFDSSHVSMLNCIYKVLVHKVKFNVMSGATDRALEVGYYSIRWPSNPPESGSEPHLRCFPALLNVSLSSGRHGAGRAMNSGAPGRIWIKLDGPAQCPLPLQSRRTPYQSTLRNPAHCRAIVPRTATPTVIGRPGPLRHPRITISANFQPN